MTPRSSATKYRHFAASASADCTPRVKSARSSVLPSVSTAISRLNSTITSASAVVAARTFHIMVAPPCTIPYVVAVRCPLSDACCQEPDSEPAAPARMALADASGFQPGVRMDLKQHIRDIPDFPKPGILFKDITPLLASPDAFREAIHRLQAHYQGRRIDAVAAAEARGFLCAAPLALQMNLPLVPLRKPGKLPYRTHSLKYELEY